VAEMVRRVPTLEKRKKYNLAQIMLLVLISLFIAARIISGFETSIIFNQVRLTITIVSLILPLFLFYGVATYKRNMHLVTGIWMLFGILMNASVLIVTLSITSALGLFICISGAARFFQ
jgi:cytochrome b subunit of formate dehydrogenase